MQWLVTGGCGFIGSSLIKSLVKEGHRIWVVDNLSVGTRSDLGSVCRFVERPASELEHAANHSHQNQVELIVADILNEQTAIQAAQGMEVIVHLAANTGVGPSVEDPRSDCLANVIGTFNYLEAARLAGVKKFVLASSGAPVGECQPPIHEEVVPHPVSPYGASKLAGEAYCSAYYHSFGIETVALRFGNVYGPRSGHKNSVVAKFIRQAMRGESLEIYGDGKQTRDFIYIDDLVSAILKAASKNGIGGEIFQIATNKETTLNELVKNMLTVLNEYGIDNIKVSKGYARIGDVKRNYSDVSKARSVLGWEAAIRIDEGLRRTVEWFGEKKPQSV